MKIYSAPDLDCVFRYNEERKMLELSYVENNVYDNEDWREVEEWAVGDEETMFHGRDRTYSWIYRFIEKKLKEK